MAEKVNRREQVKSLIELGTMTKTEIADELGVKSSSVSSQMTYLRWMGFFIITDSEKHLSFCTEDEFKTWQAEIQANRKTGTTSTKTPEEQAIALAKTIANQEKAKAKWEEKAKQIEADLETAPDDEDLIDMQDEADANITLLRIKLRRNNQRAATLPDVASIQSDTSEEESPIEDAVEDTKEDVDEDTELL